MKKTIITLLLGILIGTTLTVGASYGFNASDIDFTPSDSSWNVSNVSDAIKDLKNTEDNIVKLNVGDTYFNTYEGDLLTSKDVTLNLSKGKYMVFVSFSFGHGTSNSVNEVSDSYLNYLSLKCNSNCTKTLKKEWYAVGTGTAYAYSNVYYYTRNSNQVYYVDASNDATITLTQSWAQYYGIGTVVGLTATKIAD